MSQSISSSISYQQYSSGSSYNNSVSLDRLKISSFISSACSVLGIGFGISSALGGTWGTSEMDFPGSPKPVVIRFGLTKAEGSINHITSPPSSHPLTHC